MNEHAQVHSTAVTAGTSPRISRGNARETAGPDGGAEEFRLHNMDPR